MELQCADLVRAREVAHWYAPAERSFRIVSRERRLRMTTVMEWYELSVP